MLACLGVLARIDAVLMAGLVADGCLAAPMPGPVRSSTPQPTKLAKCTQVLLTVFVRLPRLPGTPPPRLADELAAPRPHPLAGAWHTGKRIGWMCTQQPPTRTCHSKSRRAAQQQQQPRKLPSQQQQQAGMLRAPQQAERRLSQRRRRGGRPRHPLLGGRAEAAPLPVTAGGTCR